jgi:hypothetical protein
MIYLFFIFYEEFIRRTQKRYRNPMTGKSLSLSRDAIPNTQISTEKSGPLSLASCRTFFVLATSIDLQWGNPLFFLVLQFL